MSKKYIERDALIKGIDDFYHTSHIQSLVRDSEEAKILWRGIHSGVNYSRNHILEAPAADVAPVKHGEWKMKDILLRSPFAKNYYCSECRNDTHICSNYCSNCGARMDGGNK